MRDQNIKDMLLQGMLTHCERIENTIERFGRDENLFECDNDYHDSVILNMLQIGELAGRLPNDYVEETKHEINWHSIKGVRNIIVHAYGTVDLKQIGKIANKDVPALKDYCANELDYDNPTYDDGPQMSF